MKFKKTAFTLIEFLVVIVIIGILTIISIKIFSEYFAKAKAAKIATELRIIEKGFKLASIINDQKLYPLENKLGLGLGPYHIKRMVNAGKIKDVPLETNWGEGNYIYDNDGDVFPYYKNCDTCTNNPGGANIIITFDQNRDGNKVPEELDRIFDDNNGLECGKIRVYKSSFSGKTYLFYNLSDNK